MITTLENVDIIDGRRVGNTTRQIDRAIQIILNGSVCKVLDHYMNGEHEQSNTKLYNLIVNRLKLEHKSVICNLVFDYDNLIIRLKSKKEKTLELNRPRSKNLVRL